MAKFNINKKETSKGNEKSLADKVSLLENKKEFDLRHIPVSKIVPNPENFYELPGIEELAENIKEYGLMQNLEVLEIEQDGEKMYRLITGHRRLEAIKLLISQGEQIETIPCKVERNLTDIEERLRIIKSNSDTRELTQEEKRKQVEKLNELYALKAELTGSKVNKKELKEVVASDVGISAKQVERYNTINENLIPQLKDYFDNEKLSFVEAVKFARLDEQMQLAILDLLQGKDKITDEELEIIKQQNKKLVEDNKIKEKEIFEKEKELKLKQGIIENLQTEKEELESEKERNQIEQEVIEEEKKKLEAKIREEMAQLTEEELNKYKEALKESEEKAKKLIEREKELSKELEDKDRELNEKKVELEENKTKEIEIEKEEEEKEPTLTKELLEKAVNKEKFKELKSSVIQDIVKLADLAKKYETLDVAEETLKEIEKALTVYKNKTKKITN
jgi:ParB family transcriptional regulator, chromosome partitioning protein